MHATLVNLAKKAKGPRPKPKRIVVRLMSTALTGFFYTTSRLRTGEKIGCVKFDPKAGRHCLFVEGKSK